MSCPDPTPKDSTNVQPYAHILTHSPLPAHRSGDSTLQATSWDQRNGLLDLVFPCLHFLHQLRLLLDLVVAHALLIFSGSFPDCSLSARLPGHTFPAPQVASPLTLPHHPSLVDHLQLCPPTASLTHTPRLKLRDKETYLVYRSWSTPSTCPRNCRSLAVCRCGSPATASGARGCIS